jgi:Raf kinase inhibitor-like YbhB/YbcL family protein
MKMIALSILVFLAMNLAGQEATHMNVESPDFKNGGKIPKDETGEGADNSPALLFSNIPKGTKNLVLIVDDPDAPRKEPWVHWVLYNIPPEVKAVPAHQPKEDRLNGLNGAEQGTNDFRQVGYNGPLPPRGHGLHHYQFHLYALDQQINVPPGATKKQVVSAMKGHVLDEGEIVGTYERK